MNKIKIIAIAACALGLMTSCDDFLTADNKSELDAEKQFGSDPGIETAVNDAYHSLRTIYASGNYSNWFQAGTDMYCNGRNDISSDYQLYTMTALSGDNQELYKACYDGIRTAQAVTKYDNGSELSKKRVDEARVIAANYYYILVNSYGGVPLIKSFVERVDSNYTRATTQETYQYIIDELESVVANNRLDATNATKGGGRVSMEAAKALLAKTYLAAGWDLNNNDYFTKAAQYADEVINGHNGLTTKFARLYDADGSGDDNEEFIWDVEYNQTVANDKTSGGHSMHTWYWNYMGGQEDRGKYGSSSFLPTLYTLGCFQKGDERYDATFMKELPNIKNGQEGGDYWDYYTNKDKDGNYSYGKDEIQRYYPAWYETEDDINAWRNASPTHANAYVIEMAENSHEPQNMTGAEQDYYTMVKWVFGGSPCKKFDDANNPVSASGNSDYRDIHIITLPEVYLIAAEAYLQLGNTANALARLNVVHERAGNAPLTTVDINSILDERAVELYGMGERWYDLRRTKTLQARYEDYNPQAVKDQCKAIRPIPSAAMDANSALTQNPEYTVQP